jgi:fumarylacetoacetase
MTIALNETHDPARRSFVESANAADSDFPIQNLPFGVFRPGAGKPPRVGADRLPRRQRPALRHTSMS